MTLNQIAKRIWNILERKVYGPFLFTLKTSKGYKLSTDKKYAIVNLDDQFSNNDKGRYTFILCQSLQYAGFKVMIRTDKKYFENLSAYKKLLFNEDYLFVRYCPTQINSIVLVNPGQKDHTIYLFYGIQQSITQRKYQVAPYPMHPHFYTTYPSSGIFTSLRKTQKKIRVLFAGNTNIKDYKGESLETRFNIISRYNVLNFIKEQYKDTKLLNTIVDKQALYQVFENDRIDDQLLISEVKTESDDWLKMLSKSTFFICPPGVNMPWCHNLVEAMSVGTIPILQYGDLLNPALEPMHNCLSFANYEELQQAINIALSLSPDIVNKMRENVIDYFNKYLSLQSVIERINQFCASDTFRTRLDIPYIYIKPKVPAGVKYSVANYDTIKTKRLQNFDK